MARPCTLCRHPRLPDIAIDVGNGLNDGLIADRYSLSRSAVQRHRQHSGAPSPAAIAERKSAAFQALASLPSAAEVNQAYASITGRIDAIAAKAEQQDSLAVALMGLKELRNTVEAQARLADHVGSGAQVQVNTQVNVDLNAAVKEIVAAIRPRPDEAIPHELAIHFEGAPPDADALKRLEAVVDGE
jgi:hypothetical protein